MVALAALTLTLLAGCAHSAGTSPGTGNNPDISSCPAAVTVNATTADNTVCVAVGGTVTVDFGGVRWTPVDSSGPALTPVSADAGGAVFKGASAGKATLTSSRPSCPSSPGRMSCLSIVAWSVTVEVK
jgi:hypothetical protein